MNTRHFCWLLTILVAAILLFQEAGMHSPHASAQTGTKVVSSQRSYQDGRAVGEVQAFIKTDKDLKASLMLHPAPSVSLAFPVQKSAGSPAENERTLKVELSRQSRRAWLPYWRGYLEFYYKSAIEHIDGEAQLKEDRALLQLSSGTIAKLRQTMVDAPAGRRRISQTEAEDITNWLAKAAIQVVEEAKKFQ